MVLQNVTGGNIVAATALAQLPASVGWLVTAGLFSVIVITIFFVSANFRRFIYGAVFLVAGFLVYLPSRYVSKEYVANNNTPLYIFGGIIGFIAAAILIGFYLQKIKFIKNWEKNL